MKSKYYLFVASLFLIAHVHAQSVNVTQIPSGTICSGTSVEFTANPSGFSGQIYYQWYLNGTAIPGATGVKYTTSTLNNGDQIYVQCSNSTVSEMVAGSEFYYDATNPNSYRGGSATIKDLSGKGRNGTMQGYTSGSWNNTNGGVFNFNGTNQYISTGWKPSNTMSFQIAFRSLEGYGVNWNRGLISTFPLQTTPYNGFYIGTRPINNSTNNGLHYFFDNNDLGDIGTTNSTFTSTSTWYVLTVVSNAADNAGAGSIKFYLNGSTTPITTRTGKTTHAGNIVVGRTGYDTDYWLGYIANVIVYNRVLSTQEIAANYNATLAKVTGASSASVISTVTNSILLSSATGTNSQSICNNTAITNITYATTGATNATVTGLPAGVQGAWNNNVVTISGTPVPTSGTFTYTVTLTGGCGNITATGSIAINSNAVPSVPFTLTGDGCVNRTTLSSTNTFNSYSWFLNGSEIPNTNSKTYTPSVAGNYYVRVFNGTCYGISSDITINVCGITKTGQMSPTTYNMINTLGGAATNTVKGVDDRGAILNVPN